MRYFMKFIFFLIYLTEATVSTSKYYDQKDPVTDQLLIFKEMAEGPVGVLTTSAGAPVPYDAATSTLNTDLLDNEFFMDMITHITRERTPERVVHAQGTGAFGYFEVTHDISHICKADFLKKIGTKTPVAVRFSTSSGQRGSSEFESDTRGFAVKFYTREGNLDLVGFNTPMYIYGDPLHFLPTVHTARRNPATNVLDQNMSWDFLTLIPEALHINILTSSGRGLPASYKHMPGFPIHTYQVENKHGECYFCRFHFTPDAGIKNLRMKEGRNITAFDPNRLTKGLFQDIANGNFPSWTLSVQILTKDDIKEIGPKAFDVTRVIPLKDYPLHKVGKLMLNRNAKNFFAEIEQLAFCPGNLVPGVIGCPDTIFKSRRLAYRDTQIHRLGGNFNKIRVNCPFATKTYTYNRDGVPPVLDNENDVPNYYPNTFNGPVPYMEKKRSRLIDIVENRSYNADQAAELYENELTTEERVELISNLVFSLEPVNEVLKMKAIKTLTMIHKDLGYRVARELNNTMYYKY